MEQIITIKDVCANCIENNWKSEDVEVLLKQVIPLYNGLNKNLHPTYAEISNNKLSKIIVVDKYSHSTSLKYQYNQLVSSNDVTYKIYENTQDVMRIYYEVDNPDNTIARNSIELYFTIFENDGNFTNPVTEITYTGPSKTVTYDDVEYYETVSDFQILDDNTLTLPATFRYKINNIFNNESRIYFYDGEMDNDIYLDTIVTKILPDGYKNINRMTIMGSTILSGNDDNRKIRFNINNSYSYQTLSIGYSTQYTGFNDNISWQGDIDVDNGYTQNDFIFNYNTLFSDNDTVFLYLNFIETLSIPVEPTCTFEHVIDSNTVLRYYDDSRIVIEVPKWEIEYGDMIVNITLSNEPV